MTGHAEATPGTLDIDDVSVLVDGRPLVDQVSLTVSAGEVVGLVGPNGAGKSTLLRTVYRALRPTSGRVLLDGTDVWRMPGKRLARHLAAVLQEHAGDFDLTVYEVVAMGRTPHKRPFAGDDADDRAIVTAALTELDVADLAGAPFDRLSGGEKQRVLIARALAQRAGTMVLDEPTNHLDLRHQLDALRLVRRLGVTAVVALHDLNLAASFCDRLSVMQAGRVVAHGAPRDVLTPALLADVYRVEADVTEHPRTGLPQVTLLTGHDLTGQRQGVAQT
ncbi:ABC transporter ATP-binding protein [Streptomyces thermoviolaceus subsp. thermoviolaceus]|uniref:ABC transporter ATP-binding protein n=1 Tax=Streptomyces thermoviolaceus subsp. thermoviolaceus TaxID=66860 RepID=A0ABX0YTC1_STRTL|nr:ABC transporter ATP-binding protein [Streptomyces thermoviolaceus]NJP15688.1 ABC transporter ATP-binding protein [Streptomyces thermoviolaceus subsp. thermoviolaceus]GHA95686.1 ABC transporter ATP-binding protein [Streptomyces thermoviolaceus subsp. thermoviolaceus]